MAEPSEYDCSVIARAILKVKPDASLTEIFTAIIWATQGESNPVEVLAAVKVAMADALKPSVQ